MVSHMNLIESKSPQVPRSHLISLVDLKNAVVWMVSTPFLLSKSFSPCTNHLVTELKTLIAIGIAITSMFYSFVFFQFPCKVEVLIILYAFFQFYSVVKWDNLAPSLFPDYYYYYYYYYCCYYYYYSLRVFHLGISWRSFSDVWVTVSRTFLSILADINNVVVWMVSTSPLISKSSSPFNIPSVTVARVSIMIWINVTFMFLSFYNSPARFRCLSFFEILLILLYGQPGQQSPQVCKFSLFCLIL